MWRSLAIKVMMLVGAAGVIAATLWRTPPASDPPVGGPTSTDPMVVQAVPLRDTPVFDTAMASPPDVTPPTVTPTPPSRQMARQTGKPPMTGGGRSALSGGSKLDLIDLNRATQQDFERLPGIGPSLAKHLVDHRTQHGPYRRIEDLQTVKGIGAKRFERLIPFVTVSSPEGRRTGATRASRELRES